MSKWKPKGAVLVEDTDTKWKPEGAVLVEEAPEAEDSEPSIFERPDVSKMLIPTYGAFAGPAAMLPSGVRGKISKTAVDISNLPFAIPQKIQEKAQENPKVKRAYESKEAAQAMSGPFGAIGQMVPPEARRKFATEAISTGAGMASLPLISNLGGKALSAGAKALEANTSRVGKVFKVLKGPNQAQISASIGKIKNELGILRSGVEKQKLESGLENTLQKAAESEYVTNLKDIFKQNKDALQVKFNKISEGKALDTRDVLRKMSSASSQNYGNALETVSNNLAKEGQQMTVRDFENIYTKTRQKMSDGVISHGKIQSSMDKMANRYGISINEAGEASAQNLDDIIDFKDFVGQVKDMRKGLSSGFKNGVGATPDDVAFDMFQDEFGTWVAKKAPAFAELQAEYAPIAELKNQANKIFKPWDTGEYKTTQGVQFLKRFGLAKEGTREGEGRLLKAIEDGFVLQGKKIGGKKELFKDIETAGNTLRDLSDKQKLVMEEVKKKIADLNLNKAKVNYVSDSQQAKLKSALQQQIDSLYNQKLERANVDRIVNKIFWTALGLSGLGAVNVVKNISSPLRE